MYKSDSQNCNKTENGKFVKETKISKCYKIKIIDKQTALIRSFQNFCKINFYFYPSIPHKTSINIELFTKRIPIY